MSDRHEWTDPVDEVSYTVDAKRATAASTQGALCREIIRLAARVKELEAEVEKELQGQVDISESGGRMYDKLSAKIREMEAVVAPLLPLFRELEADWRLLSKADFPHRDTVTLTAEFPVEALRALAKEEE